MADELAEKYSNLHLEEDENEIVDFRDVDSTESEARVSLMLVGKLLTDRGINLEAFKRTILQSWGMKGKVVIRGIGPNLFVFQFFHWRDMEKVLSGRPWCFEQNLLILNNITGDEQPNEVKLTHSPFWIRLENLPFNCRSDTHVKVIAAKLGDLIEIDNDVLGIGKNRRIKVSLDVSKPLRRFQCVKNKDGNTVKIILKYERLPFFCFMCGIMGHSEKDCVNIPEELQNQGLGWGTWLKASPRRGLKLETEEVRVLNAVKKLQFVTKNQTLLSEVGEGTTIVPTGQGDSSTEEGRG